MHTACNEKPSFLQLGAHFPPFVRLCWIPTLPHTHTRVQKHTAAFHLQNKIEKKKVGKKLCLYLPVYSFLFALLFGSAIRCYFVLFQFCTQNGGRTHAYILTPDVSYVCACFAVFTYSLLLAGFVRSCHLFPPLLSESDSRRCFRVAKAPNEKVI